MLALKQQDLNKVALLFSKDSTESDIVTQTGLQRKTVRAILKSIRHEIVSICEAQDKLKPIDNRNVLSKMTSKNIDKIVRLYFHNKNGLAEYAIQRLKRMRNKRKIDLYVFLRECEIRYTFTDEDLYHIITDQMKTSNQILAI